MKNAGEGGLVARIRRMIMHLSQYGNTLSLSSFRFPMRKLLVGKFFYEDITHDKGLLDGSK